MKTPTIFDTHVKEYDAWYEKYPAVFQSEVLALRDQFAKLPENILGIEVGLGTGRFSQALGLKEGVEPSEAMAALARARGIEIMEAVAEYLPYRDLHFDFVLFVTICHLQDLKAAVTEAHRVLKHGGAIIIGFLDNQGLIAQSYKVRGTRSTFYASAIFYKAEKLVSLLKATGFKDIEFNQTLFGQLEEITQIQQPKPGTGEGSFVVLKATKK